MFKIRDTHKRKTDEIYLIVMNYTKILNLAGETINLLTLYFR